MQAVESLKKPIEASQVKTPAQPQRTPELQAQLDAFHKQIGPAMVEALRKATTQS